MIRNQWSFAVFAWVLVLSGAMCEQATAGTIIKLSLGNDAAPDITFDGIDLETNGIQDTAVQFTGFLSGMTAIPANDATFSLVDVVPDGPASVGGGIVVQPFDLGTLELYDADSNLLLSADLGTSSLAGPIGGIAATGAVFSTSLGTVTGGSLASKLVQDSISLSISLTNVNGGAGLSVTQVNEDYELDDFVADATLNIAADEIPEPATIMCAMLAFAVGTAVIGRGRRD